MPVPVEPSQAHRMVMLAAVLLLSLRSQLANCLSLPPPNVELEFPTEMRIVDPDFPQYWQVPRHYLVEQSPMSLGAAGATTEIRGPPLTTPSRTSPKPKKRTRCKPQKEKYLMKLLADYIPLLQQFTPIALCPSVRRQQSATRRPQEQNATRTRFDWPRTCRLNEVGPRTQCPYKLSCSYDATRYPPLLYEVTCLQRRALTWGRRSEPFVGCAMRRECTIVTQWVPVLRLASTTRCDSQGREQWIPTREMLPVRCACPSPVYSG
eukprot:scpid74233/ scgid26293/ 